MPWEKEDGHWQWISESDEITFDSAAELLEMAIEIRQRPAPDEGDYWGKWVYSGGDPACITHREHNYEIALYRIRETAQFIDWVAHLQKKPWMTSQDMGDFIEAIDDLVGLRRFLPKLEEPEEVH